MRTFIIISIILISNFSIFGQTENKIRILLSNLDCNSEEIIKDSLAKLIIDGGEKNLIELASFFADSTVSNVYSKCAKRNLLKGEIALILVDHIEMIPYFTLIGLQNCTLETCDKNPNIVEYYLEFMKNRRILKNFGTKYNEWLKSSEREKYRKIKN